MTAVRVSPNVQIHWDRVERALILRQEALRKVRFDLASDMRVLLHLSPAPSARKALDAIEAAITEIETLKSSFKEAAR